jgi:uncharacterized protein (DUF2461 family)
VRSKFYAVFEILEKEKKASLRTREALHYSTLKLHDSDSQGYRTCCGFHGIIEFSLIHSVQCRCFQERSKIQIHDPRLGDVLPSFVQQVEKLKNLCSDIEEKKMYCLGMDGPEHVKNDINLKYVVWLVRLFHQPRGIVL